MASQTDTVVGIDLGGTKIAAAVVSPDGQMLARAHVPTEADGGPEHVVARLVEIVQQLQSEAARPLAAIGIGVPAPLSPSQGIVWEAPNMPGWERYPIREALRQRLGIPVALENDARAAGLAEARVGAGRGFSNMLYITVGTGVGGALIIGGKPLWGAAETAGEIGHMVMVADGFLCGCGNHGCLEQYSAGPAIERRAASLVALGAISSLSTISREDLTGELVAEAAQQGDRVGLQAYREAGEWLGLAAASVVNLVSPGIIVVGGGVAQTGDLILAPMREMMSQHTLQRARQGVEIVPARLGTDAGILGAAMAAFDLIGSAPH